MLEPNLSLDTATSPGTIRLDLAQASHEDTNNRQKCPRLPVQVPAADVGASDGIASVTLHAVRLCVDVLEPRQSTNPKAKRSRAPTNIDAVRSVPDAYRKDLGSEREFEVFGNKNSLSHPIVRNDSQKRRRLTTTHHQHGQAEEHDDDVVDALLDQESYSTECETDVPGSQANCAAAHLVSLIEGAMMVVITGSLGKSANGFKMKANTIQRGLSDIAPTIWRPGFATTLRQRAYLAPTISQSMAHMICSEIDKSPSVPSSRVINLVAIIEHDFKDNGKDVGIVPNKRRNKVSTALTDQVWMHMHNALCL
ncbi:hypothetical protein NX059_008814 [Plenodomus lindquistii]|nr:hypothetical protein NX059_008814 [Plenodomus lindquistii]